MDAPKKKRMFELNPALMGAVLECEKRSQGHFGTFRCAVKKKKELSFLKSLFASGYVGIYSNARKLFAIDMFLLALVLLAGTASAVFLLWHPSIVKFIELEIKQTPEIAQNGQEVTYSITYKNTSEVELQNVELKITPPSGFFIQKALPEERWNSARKTFTLPDAPPRMQATVTLEGIILANHSINESLTAELFYNQKDKTRKERKPALREISVSDSVFAATYQVPEAVLRGSTFTVTTTLEHNAAITLNNVVIKHPFSGVGSASPELTENTWRIERFPPRTPLTFVITGAAQESESIAVELTPVIEHEGIALELPLKNSTAVAVIDPRIDVQLTETWGETLEYGNPLSFAFEVANNGPWPIETLALTLSPTQLVRLSGGSDMLLTNNVITWNALEALEPGEKTHVRGALTIPNLTNSDSIEFVLEGRYTLQRDSTQLNGNLIPHVYSHTLLALPELQTEARYFNVFGDQLGRGPLPPRAGEETKYWVHWSVKGGSRVFENIRVSAPLPSHVRFTGKGSVTMGHAAYYDTESRSVVWNAGALKPNDVVDIFFELAVTPTAAHRGASVLVMGETTLNARAAERGSSHSIPSGFPLTSELYNDEFAKSYGSAVE